MLTRDEFYQLKIDDYLEYNKALLQIENIPTTAGGDTYAICKVIYPNIENPLNRTYLHQQTIETYTTIKLLTKERLEYYNKLIIFA